MQKVDVKKNLYYIFLFLIILSGIAIRLKGFLSNPSFWHDECAMAWNIKSKSYWELFGHLRFLQVTPPFLSVLTKFFTQILGYSEMVFRFIPCSLGCLSIIAFYFLSKKALNNSFLILLTIFLFSINPELIKFSIEFKPYESDVFFTIICILFFVTMDIKSFSIKKACFWGIILAFVPWFSIIGVFALIGGFLNLFKDFKSDLNKKIILVLPLFVSSLIYLKTFVFVNYTQTHMVQDWQNYFVTLNLAHFVFLMAKSFKYLFFPVQNALFFFIFVFFGGIIFLKEKSLFFKISVYTFLAFIFASFCKLYPFGDRVILFLIPIYLLWMIKPLDYLALKNKKLLVIGFLIFIFLFIPQYQWVYDFILSNTINKGEYPREMMKELASQIKEKDIILIPNSSDTEFAYYSMFYNFGNKIIQERKYNSEQVLQSLTGGHYCWVYSSYGEFENIYDWIVKHAKIIKIIKYQNTNNNLIYIYVK